MIKQFSLEEANKSLVFVKPILSDILELLRSMQIIEKNANTTEEIMADKKKMDSVLEMIKHHINELFQVGCVCKDIENGYVDFPCIHEGELIYLCLNTNDQTIGFWHPVDTDFQQRIPINEEFIFIESLKTKKDQASSLAS